VKETPVGINDLPLQDNMDLYQFDDPASIVTMYVTVRKGNSTDSTDHTWQEVNDFTKWLYDQVDIVDPLKTEAVVQVGDETGPLPGELGYGEVVPNATIAVRGASSSEVPPKSYKIELRNRAGQWRGQSTIALLKNKDDPTRLRSKLSFDLLEGIPSMVSLRTQFVHLYVKDETIDPPSDIFMDYGLFTQVEQPNKAFLRNHILDSDGQLYKPNFFKFYRYAGSIKLIDDPLYDENAFFKILETKGNKDHSKLINMLDEINDWDTPIQITFEKNFDADNYFTWLAFNILVGSVNTHSQNFYLYSPKNSQTWYFLPWDYDQAFFRQDRELFGYSPYEPWEVGVSNYWDSVLHNRILREDVYRQMLDEKINNLLPFLASDRIESMLNEYRTVTDPLNFSMPDLLRLKATNDEYEYSISLIPTEAQNNYELYLESLDTPMPFYLGTPQRIEDKLQFNWESSYDFDGQDITYQFLISKDWEFNEIAYEAELINVTFIEIDMLDPGTYFWRAIATNEDGFSQIPYDYYYDSEGEIHAGVKNMYIFPDGKIFESASKEVIAE
jgi:spore coat protein H